MGAPETAPAVRVIVRPVFSFEEWAAARGVPAEDLTRDADVAELIGGAFAERTRR